MGVDDEKEKLKTAGEWLLKSRPPNSEAWNAALDHVTWTLNHTERSSLRAEAYDILEAVRDKMYPTNPDAEG